MKNIKQYYKHLGRLLYSVAIADGMVQDEERNKLKAFVIKELAAREISSDSSGMNNAFYVDFEFEESASHPQSLNDVIVAYNHFIQHNAETGDNTLLENSLVLLKTVANAYTRKKENDIVDVIESKMEEINKALLNI